MRCWLAGCLLALGAISGCGGSTTGPVTTPEELDKYNIPDGEAQKAAQEAAAAAAARGN